MILALSHLRRASTCSRSPTVIDRFLLYLYRWDTRYNYRGYVLDISNFIQNKDENLPQFEIFFLYILFSSEGIVIETITKPQRRSYRNRTVICFSTLVKYKILSKQEFAFDLTSAFAISIIFSRNSSRI